MQIRVEFNVFFYLCVCRTRNFTTSAQHHGPSKRPFENVECAFPKEPLAQLPPKFLCPAFRSEDTVASQSTIWRSAFLFETALRWLTFRILPFILTHTIYFYTIEPGSLPCSGPSSSASSVSSASLPSPPGSPMMHNHLQDDFVRSEQFQQEVQGKLITLEELVRMRRVLTAASLENLPLDSSVKDDVACGKVCFVCRKTRFSVFNTKTWWHNCKLCRRTVCIKCCSKVNIRQQISLDVRWKSWTIKAGTLYGWERDFIESRSA